MNTMNTRRNKMDPKYDSPTNLTLQKYNYSQWYTEKPGDENKLSDLPPLESDEDTYYSAL